MRVSAPSVTSRARPIRFAATALAICALMVFRPTPATAQGVVHFFVGGATDGAISYAGLIAGGDGAFYGTTVYGGTARAGTVYRLASDGTFSLSYSFTGPNGNAPGAALLLGPDGNFYGTTQFGGLYGEGTLFQLTPGGQETVLMDFGAGYGEEPVASLVLGPDGNLYGTTQYGGYNDDGCVFQCSLTGAYTELFDFGNGYGSVPIGALAVGPDGNLYGTTENGGLYGYGTVFQISTTGSLSVIYDFQGQDGAYPQGTLVLLPGSTTFYGTASSGGANGNGSVFEITTTGTFTKLHDFNYGDGDSPESGLVLAQNGNFYGTTFDGGSQDGGTVFEISPAGAFTTVAAFSAGTGENPVGPLLEGTAGTLYGTTSYGGGSANDGTIFTLAIPGPAAVPSFFNGETSVGNGVYYLTFPNGNYFGYYTFLSSPGYIYHFDLGYEYVIDANDGFNGVYLYDFTSSDFFYTSPSFPFPYLYDFNLQAVLYYYGNPNSPGHYTTSPRFFYNFSTGQIIAK